MYEVRKPFACVMGSSALAFLFISSGSTAPQFDSTFLASDARKDVVLSPSGDVLSAVRVREDVDRALLLSDVSKWVVMSARTGDVTVVQAVAHVYGVPSVGK